MCRLNIGGVHHGPIKYEPLGFLLGFLFRLTSGNAGLSFSPHATTSFCPPPCSRRPRPRPGAVPSLIQPSPSLKCALPLTWSSHNDTFTILRSVSRLAVGLLLFKVIAVFDFKQLLGVCVYGLRNVGAVGLLLLWRSTFQQGERKGTSKTVRGRRGPWVLSSLRGFAIIYTVCGFKNSDWLLKLKVSTARVRFN